VKLLLDTHALLWFHEEDPQLSGAAASALEDPENECYVSYGSIWEMAIKTSLGKLRLPAPLAEFVQDYIVKEGFGLLEISVDHLNVVASLPHYHGDPFDRLLVAQSITEGWRFVSNEALFERYGVSRLW
jgi:PIN domain nuclease of toxin-antitoxin system